MHRLEYLEFVYLDSIIERPHTTIVRTSQVGGPLSGLLLRAERLQQSAWLSASPVAVLRLPLVRLSSALHSNQSSNHFVLLHISAALCLFYLLASLDAATLSREVKIMEPLTAIGAVASAAQLFEMALKYSNKAYNFIAAFRKADEHAAILHQKLHEVNLLMRDLQQYMNRNRQTSNAGLGQDKPLHQSVIEIAKQFADDMICLHKLLPYDRNAFSASIRKRTKFVIKEKDAAQILARLEGRKSAATLALALVGRQVDILAAIKELRQLVDRNDAAVARQQHAFAEVVARSIADVQSQIATILAQQNSMLAPKSLQVSKADVVASDADVLSRLIRAELRQQLEPLLNQFDKASEHIDRVAMAFASETVTNDLFRMGETSSKSKFANTSTQDQRSKPQESVQQAAPSAASQVTSGKDARVLQPQRVYLSCFTHKICSRIGSISVILRTYRLRRPGANSGDTHFELRAHIIPSASLYCRGLSALYSSGPDCCGYFSITPRISLVNIIADGAEIYDVISDDDVRRFRMLLEEGKFGIWDLDCNGINLIEADMKIPKWSASAWAPLICQYLLRDSGYGAQLIERNGLTMSQLAPELAYCIVATEPELAEDILTHVKRLTSDSIEEDKDHLYYLGWYNFLQIVQDEYEDVDAQRSGAVLYGSMLFNAGYKLRAFEWNTHDIELNLFFMDLYITMGVNPQGTTPDGAPLMYAALRVTACVLCQVSCGGVACIANGTGHRASEHQQREWCVALVRMLIQANVNPVFFDECCQFAICAACLADQLGILDVWEEALKDAGFNPTATHARMHFNANFSQKLHNANRTGVDVAPLIEQPSMSGLRQRKALRRSIGEIEA
ncbi:hypothetical protein PWT90_00806 [Aphanocladium album]|nr:hypothetical protein PWT90_00806 [Aphanocladium album]